MTCDPSLAPKPGRSALETHTAHGGRAADPPAGRPAATGQRERPAPEVSLRFQPSALLLGLAGAAGIAVPVPAASGQVFDSFVAKIEVNQAIQTGSTPLVAGRTTFVRAVVRLQFPPFAPIPIDGLMRVFVDGVEQPGSPIYSDNGPFPDMPGTGPENENATLNFVFLPPQSSSVVLTVEGNAAGPNFFPEANTANNTLATPTLAFVAHGVPELVYVPIDYRPTGGSIPNVPDPAMIAPGMGDNFVQGIYPGKDWNYRRSDAPSKLWTSSLAGSGSPLLDSLTVDINLMVPKPDFMYGFVPGPLPGYNGQSIIGGKVSMGNTEQIRYQRTLAHEIGHNFGLVHNTLTTGLVGVDTEHHLHLPLLLPQIKAASLKDIMYAGLLTQEAWVATPSYSAFFNHPAFVPGAAATASDGPGATGAPGAPGAPVLMVAGTWNRATGALQFTDVLELPSAELTPAVAPQQAELLVRAFAGGAELTALPIVTRDSADGCTACRPAAGSDSEQSPAITGFTAILPARSPTGAPIDRLLVGPAGAQNAATLSLQRSASAPQVAFASPDGQPLAGPALTVSWTAVDADGDALTSYLRYSPDGTRFVPILTSTPRSQADVDFTTVPAFVDGQGFFELFASDGLNTTVVRSAPLRRGTAWKGTADNPPRVDMLTPDDATSYLKGATVILHSSGWDLEDGALEGASIAWSSSVDGAIGTGRLLSVASLSVGAHVITVTATDVASQTTSDTASITIVDRGLPATGPVCQADLGSGGPGSSVLSVCGGDLSTGTTADVLLTGAPPLTPAFAVLGVVQGSVPFKGGTLVPVPWLMFVPLATDIDGAVSVPGIVGGGGPFSAYLQFAVVDPGQPQGVGLSNAVRIDVLP